MRRWAPRRRLQREAWTYNMHLGQGQWKELYVQFSPDDVMREIAIVDDPGVSSMSEGM